MGGENGSHLDEEKRSHLDVEKGVSRIKKWDGEKGSR